MTYDRKVIRMDENQWKKDIMALYAAAERRAWTINGTSYVVTREEEMDAGLEGLQRGILWVDGED